MQTFSSISVSPRGKRGPPGCKDDPTLGNTSPTELPRPSFPRLMLLLFSSIFSLLFSSLTDCEFRFCWVIMSCCWCCGVNMLSWWNDCGDCINGFCCWRRPERSWSNPYIRKESCSQQKRVTSQEKKKSMDRELTVSGQPLSVRLLPWFEPETGNKIIIKFLRAENSFTTFDTLNQNLPGIPIKDPSGTAVLGVSTGLISLFIS